MSGDFFVCRVHILEVKLTLKRTDPREIKICEVFKVAKFGGLFTLRSVLVLWRTFSNVGGGVNISTVRGYHQYFRGGYHQY